VIAKALRSQKGPVLITGHTGCKGTWLSLLLNCLDIENFGYSLEAEPESLHNRLGLKSVIPSTIGDIRDIGALKKCFMSSMPSIVVHLAAQPLVLRSYKIPIETFEVNVLGTANVLQTAFETSSVKVVLVITTDKVYRNDESGKRFVEGDPLSGKDPYSSSKVGVEAVCSAWQQISKLSGGPKVIVARAGNVIGGGDLAEDRIIPDLIRGVISNQVTKIRNPSATRPWQHVLDPLKGYLLYIEKVLEEEVDISVLNFGPSEVSLEVSKVIQIGQETFGRRMRVDLDATIEEREVKALELNASLAGELLEWVPRWSQESAIASTFQWWKSTIADEGSSKENCLRDIGLLLNQKE
jgi:CDP-glucose 4,6-dehydratase